MQDEFDFDPIVRMIIVMRNINRQNFKERVLNFVRVDSKTFGDAATAVRSCAIMLNKLAEVGEIDIIRKILENPSVDRQIPAVCMNLITETPFVISYLEVLVGHGVDINGDIGGYAILHRALRAQWNVHYIEKLIKLGADVYAKDTLGYSALDLADDKSVRSMILSYSHSPDVKMAE